MSLSYQKLKPVLVRDPRTILTNEREYAVLRAGSQTTMKQFTTTSISNSSIQFSCPPPSGGIIVDRKIYLYLPVRLTFSGLAPIGSPLINMDQDSPRAWPLMGSIDTFQVTINNQSVSINIADIVHSLMHFNTDRDLTESDYSMTPNMLDQSQQYSSLFGAIRSPLASYGDSNDQSVMARGAFPFTIVSNPLSTSPTIPITAVVDMSLCEPLLLSPMYFGKDNGCGFFNVNTMDFNITFLGNAGFRMWSHDATSVGIPTTISSITTQFNGFSGPAFSYPDVVPFMLFTYITPNETQIIPYNMPITYPYFDVQRFPTDTLSAAAVGVPKIYSSNNIQLNSIPRRMYIYLRRRNQDLFNTSAFTDTFLSIENISIQFQNKNGLLSSANKRQLYEMSLKNHCNMNWTQWSGGPVYNPNLTSQYGTIGSIVAIEFASDIGLDSIEAPGKLGQYMLQVQVTATNISNDASLTPTLYIVVVSEGSFTIEGLGKASTNIGVITSQDILDAQSNPFVNYNDIQCVNGGNFLSGLKNFGREILSGAKNVNNFLREHKPISTISGLIPHPAAQSISQISRSLGYGEGIYAGEEDNEGCGYGNKMGAEKGLLTKLHRGEIKNIPSMGIYGKGSGVVVGGRKMNKSELRRKLMM